ncbi:MAG: hypothetical protein GXP51_05525 [Deltaproteobacteria bacterium]|nr:hypothetical protein [Deltaproteobacteria bacterium]
MTGNMLGLNHDEIKELDPEELAVRMNQGRQTMLEAGAHYVIDGFEQLPALIATINRKIAQGEKP